jgi:Kef-type K+ transport system membrane component KefB
MEHFTRPIVYLLAVLVLVRLADLVSRRVNIPAVTVQLLIGVLLGPSLLDLPGIPMVLGTWGSRSPGLLHGVLKILAEIGLIQLMFLAGLTMDWDELRKLSRSFFSAGALGFILTAVSVAAITRLFVDRWAEALAMSAILSASSFGISVYYFSGTKVFGSRVAAMVSGAAIISGLLAILLMITSQAANYAATYGSYKMAIAVSWLLAKLIMFFAIAYFLTSRFLGLAAKTGFQKKPRQMIIGYLLLIASLYAWAALHFGSFASVCVASLGGALLGTSNPAVKEKIAKGFGSFLTSLPVGVLFVVLGMEVNLKAIEGAFVYLAILLVCVAVAKLAGSWIVTKKRFPSSHERTLIMFGGLAQGEMGILIAAYLFSRGTVNPSFFHIGIIAVVLLTTIVPVLTKTASVELRMQTMPGKVTESRNG